MRKRMRQLLGIEARAVPQALTAQAAAGARTPPHAEHAAESVDAPKDNGTFPDWHLA